MSTDLITPAPSDNTHNGAHDDDHEAAAPPPSSPAPQWPDWAVHTLAGIRRHTRRATGFVRADAVGAVTLLGAVLGTVFAVVVAFEFCSDLVTWLVHGDPVGDLTRHLPIARLVTDPIRQWLAAHTTGLPLSTRNAACLWGATGVVLFYAACRRHLGAQLLWPLYVIATGAMVWFGTELAAYRPVATGLLAIAASALSLLALRRPTSPEATR